MSEMSIQQLYALSDSDCEILYHYDCEEYSLEIRQFDNIRWLHLDGVSIQSVMDTSEPVKIINPVNALMLAGMTIPDKPSTILNLGLGGASIERYLLSEWPNIDIHSVENNEHIIHLARDFFQLPYEHPVYMHDAEQILHSLQDSYDVIFSDLFAGEEHPDCLFIDTFYQDIAEHLSEDGVCIMNVLTDNEDLLIKLLQALRQSLVNTHIIKLEEHSNAVIYASRKKYSTTEIEKKIRTSLSEALIAPIPFNWQCHHLSN